MDNGSLKIANYLILFVKSVKDLGITIGCAFVLCILPKGQFKLNLNFGARLCGDTL
jgi:hypothetical protein